MGSDGSGGQERWWRQLARAGATAAGEGEMRGASGTPPLPLPRGSRYRSVSHGQIRRPYEKINCVVVLSTNKYGSPMLTL